MTEQVIVDGVYSVHDDVAQIHFAPFTFRSDEEACRMFSNCVNDAEHAFAKNPSDYGLYKVGEWDKKTGILYPATQPKLLAIGTDFSRKREVVAI